MMISKTDLSFKGLYGCYTKNNRKYAINIKRANSALEVIKEPEGHNTLKFYKRFAMEKESIRTIKNIQSVQIDKIDDESGVILSSDETFKIPKICGLECFVEIGKKAKLIVDKMESCILFMHSFGGSIEQRAFIKDAEAVEIRNMQNDKSLDVFRAQKLFLFNSGVDERINVKAEEIHIGSCNGIELSI